MRPEENDNDNNDAALAFARGGAPVRQGRPYEQKQLKDSHYDGFDQDKSLALSIPSQSEIGALRQIGESMVASGLCAKFKNADAALMAMLTGREMGLNAMASIRGIDVITTNKKDGDKWIKIDTPFIKPILMLAVARRSGQLEYFDLTKSATRAVCTVQRKGFERKSYPVTIEDANRKKWSERNPNYQTQPDTMLGHRAVGEALREQFTDYFMGMGLPGDEGGYIEDFNDARSAFHANDPLPERHINAGEVVSAETTSNGDSGALEAEVVEPTDEFIDGENKERAILLGNKLLDAGVTEDELATLTESIGGVRSIAHVAAGEGPRLIAALAQALSTRLSSKAKKTKPFASE